MKKKFAFMLGIAAMFASCSKTEELTAESETAKEVTFSLSADSGLQTRAAGTLRYLMAIYDESGQAEVLKATEFGSSSFAVRLDPGKYTCLFWADYGSDNYDATDLKSVALKDAASDMQAFCAKQGITVTDGETVNVTLSRAVAKLVLKETDRLEAGSITVSYDGFKGYDVSQGTGINASTLTHTLTVASVIEGSAAAPTEVGSILMLAGSDERILADFKFQYKTATKTEDEKTITNVPVQANYVTNINGKFSVNVAQQFSITVDDNWVASDKEVDFPPYLTFSAESGQTFTMDFLEFSLGENEYFEYAVGDGEWAKFTTTVSGIAFGGAKGDLRLRGKSSKGTAIDGNITSRISFGTSGVLVDCSGDIRTLIDYENYATASTAEARFCRLFQYNQLLRTAPELPASTLADYCYRSMFYGCTSLTQAPELPATTLARSCYSVMFDGCTSLTQAPKLPATTLADWCYFQMFNGCTSLSSITMLATNVSAPRCLENWLKDAGTNARSRTLTVADSEAYGKVESYLPDNWKSGQATIKYAK